MILGMFPSPEPWPSIPIPDLVTFREVLDLAVFVTFVFYMAYKGHGHAWESGMEFGRWYGFGRDRWVYSRSYRIDHQMEPKWASQPDIRRIHCTFRTRSGPRPSVPLSHPLASYQAVGKTRYAPPNPSHKSGQDAKWLGCHQVERGIALEPEGEGMGQ